LKYCPKCGTQIGDNDLYCHICGEYQNVCTSCNFVISSELSDAKYCPNCGQQLKKTSALFDIPWSIGDVFKTLGFSLLIVYPLVFAVSYISGLGYISELIPIILSIFMNHLLILYFMLHYIRKRGGSLKDIGLNFVNPRLFALGTIAGVGVLALNIFINILLNPIIGSSPIQEDFLNLSNYGLYLVFAVFGSIIVPIIEEMYFRGFSYQAFKKRWGRNWGMLINGIFFATIHLDPWVFIPTLIIGVLLAYIFEKTKSLPLVIIAHAINNSIAFLV
jgi:membrane protease YdiL (CAAX protease family)/predicted RNA-binding Zn-ribbon protein involved in translation (DUF1610 family)